MGPDRNWKHCQLYFTSVIYRNGAHTTAIYIIATRYAHMDNVKQKYKHYSSRRKLENGRELNHTKIVNLQIVRPRQVAARTKNHVSKKAPRRRKSWERPVLHAEVVVPVVYCCQATPGDRWGMPPKPKQVKITYNKKYAKTPPPCLASPTTYSSIMAVCDLRSMQQKYEHHLDIKNTQ